MKTDLKNGILDIDGFLLNPKTVLSNIDGFFGTLPYRNIDEDGDVFIGFEGRPFFINGQSFYVNNLWILDGKLTQVELTPVIPEVGDDYVYASREVCGKWLKEQLGEPRPARFPEQRTILYKFSWGSVGYFSEWVERDGYWKYNRIIIEYG